MGGHTKTKTTESKTQTSAPPAWTLPGLTSTAGKVTSALGDVPSTHYDGPQVAFMSPDELAAIQGAWMTTAGQAGDLTDYMQNRLPELSSEYNFTTQLPSTAYDVGSQYDVNPVIQASLDPVYRQLTQQILPGIKSSALDSGAYTSDRSMLVAPEQALQDYSKQAADTAAAIGYQNYNDFENRRLAAYNDQVQNQLAAYGAETQRGLGQETANTNMMGAINDYVSGILHNSASVGDLLRMSADLGVANDQASINDALARDKYASYAPFMGLDEASQLLAELSGHYGTINENGQSTTDQSYQPGALDFIQAGLGIAGAIAGMPGLGIGGGATSGLGAMGKTAGSMFTSGAPMSISMDPVLTSNPFAAYSQG